jgi:hypothetical protein
VHPLRAWHHHHRASAELMRCAYGMSVRAACSTASVLHGLHKLPPHAAPANTHPSTGCFPGYGVYGPVLHNPNKCEECPAGTYSTGGALAPCQPCANDAFQYLTSAPGSTSIADCACAAGAVRWWGAGAVV